MELLNQIMPPTPQNWFWAVGVFILLLFSTSKKFSSWTGKIFVVFGTLLLMSRMNNYIPLLIILVFVQLIMLKKKQNKFIQSFSLSLILVLLAIPGKISFLLLVFAFIQVLGAFLIFQSKSNFENPNQAILDKAVFVKLIIFISTVTLIYFKLNNNFNGLILIKLPVVVLFLSGLLLLFNERLMRVLVPVLIVLFVRVLETNSQIVSGIAWGEFWGVLIAYLSFRFKFLSLTGSIATFLLATVVFGIGGLSWTIPILTFFIPSSFLSKVGKSKKKKFEDTFEKSGTRDLYQVFANGGIGGILAILSALYPEYDYWYFLYILSLMVATADTWSTELGVLSKKPPILITTFKPVKPGISGGISFFGTISGLAGSALILFSGSFFTHFTGFEIIILLVLSVFGNFLDSIIGATIQAQYQCNVCQKYTEKQMHCNQSSKIISGFHFINNDIVNFFSNFFTVIFLILILNF